MTVRRIVPNLAAGDPTATREFYAQLLGLGVAMDLGWIITFAEAEHPATQLSAITTDQTAPVNPTVSIEVDDVDAVHEAALNLGHDIIYPLTTEPWGVRRFFVRDPGGNILNILSHA
jgi:predicted enzyme related to lactoylglutathione lyase